MRVEVVLVDVQVALITFPSEIDRGLDDDHLHELKKDLMILHGDGQIVEIFDSEPIVAISN